MTKVLLVAALMVSSSAAMASKARVNSLQGAMTVATDFQDTLGEPARMFEVSDAFTLEFGEAQNVAGAKGEGGLIRTAGDAKWGVYFGKQADSMNGYATAAGLNAAVRHVDNPFYVSYAMKGGAMSWGVGLYYTSSAVKKGATQNKKDAMALNASLLGANWGAYLNLGLTGKVQYLQTDAAADDQTLTMKSNMKLGGRYDMDDLSIGGSYTAVAGKAEGNGTTDASVATFDREQSTLAVDVESKIKTDNAHFFYGAGLSTTTIKNKITPDKKEDIMTVPLKLGIEAEAASWLTLRGAYSQALSLIDSNKSSTATTPTATETEEVGTTKHKVTAGAGWKFNKTHIDFELAAATNGNLSTTAFGTNAGLTYWF